jgi:hypothetical protein
MGRIIFAGILGGVAMFVWSSFAHLSTPLGTLGVSELRSEEAVMASMHTVIDENGLYVFPGLGLPDTPTREQREAATARYEERVATMPSGIIVFNPPGSGGMTAMRMIGEFASQMFEAMVLAFVLGLTTLTGLAPRLALGAAFGAAAVSSTNVSYFLWFGFPVLYTLGYMLTDFIGYLAATAVIMSILKAPGATR